MKIGPTLLQRKSRSLLLALGIVWVSFAQILFAAPQDHGVDYDIVYVRYPAVDPNDPYVTIPQGEGAYSIQKGADLMLLHPDGSEEVLVDCTDCSVMDPFISFDGRYVYYSRIDNIPELSYQSSGGFIWKIDLQATAPRPQIQLTFNDGFDCEKYAGNSGVSNPPTQKLRDMAPFPIAGGKVGFTSNRSCLHGMGTGSELSFLTSSSVQQIYVIDDHDGSKNTATLSNMHRLENGSIRMVQHPMQLKDGRILFSTWQDVANKFDYAMTSLFTIHPDGSNMMQFTEPHDHSKFLDHFITQLPNEDVVYGNYYPSFDYGFGILYRAPINPDGVDVVRNSLSNNGAANSREFYRKEEVNITPHTSGNDVPAPEIGGVPSGKYSMPSYAKDGHMLTAWSSGYVNFFDAHCASQNKCDSLKSGIYLIRNAETSVVTSPFDSAQMVPMIDLPDHNEIWPRAVLSYQEMYGIEEPNWAGHHIERDGPEDNRLSRGEVAALLGTSSMINRDPSDNAQTFAPNSNREQHDGNWRIQGAEAGVFTNEDVYAVRIVATPEQIYTSSLTGSQKSQIERYLKSPRLDNVTFRYGSANEEQWEILGEFILPHTASTDQQGNKDTSWVAKVPAETPLLIQTLDRNGMTINSELTWRALKAGEKRVDCGGCHVHSAEPLDYNTTQSGQRSAIQNIPGIANNEPRISESYFDLTKGAPLLTEAGMTFSSDKTVTVEFNRDIQPIINNRCVACHTDGQANGGLVLTGTGENDAYGVLAGRDGNYSLPQFSKYIRTPQARESLLVWAVYGERLDGRTNSDRSNDLDFTSHPAITGLTDDEKRTFARWVDLGSPIDFPQTDGFGYTDDNQLPVINIDLVRGSGKTGSRIRIGISDAKSDIDWSSLVVRSAEMNNGVAGAFTVIPNSEITVNSDNVATVKKPLLQNYLVEVSVRDTAGNLNTERVVTETLALSTSNVGF